MPETEHQNGIPTTENPNQQPTVATKSSKKSVKKAVKGAAKTKGKKLAGKAKKVVAAKVPWTFPKHTLDDAIRIAKAVEDKNAGNPMPASSVASAVGYRQPQDWRFLELLRSANQYGLVDGTGPTARISLIKLGQDIVAPASLNNGLMVSWPHFDM